MRVAVALFAGAGAMLLVVASNLSHNEKVALVNAGGLACFSMTWLIPYLARERKKKRQREKILRDFAPPGGWKK